MRLRSFLPSRALVLTVLYLVSLAGILYLALLGASYYQTPMAERPRNPEYWIFKPGGRLGLVYAASGTAAMMAMHLYSLRKRMRWLRRLGRLGSWLDFHIYLGIFGPLLILLHTSFKFRGIVSISFWSMVVVAVSGLLGRFLYLQLPRTGQGEELSLAEAEAEHLALAKRMQRELGVAPEELVTHSAGQDAGTLRLFWRPPFEPLALRLALGRLRRGRWRRLPKSVRRRLTALTLHEAELRRKLLFWNRLHEVFHYWHVFHRPFALLLYLFLAVHVAVAFSTGYGGSLWR